MLFERARPRPAQRGAEARRAVARDRLHPAERDERARPGLSRLGADPRGAHRARRLQGGRCRPAHRHAVPHGRARSRPPARLSAPVLRRHAPARRHRARARARSEAADRRRAGDRARRDRAAPGARHAARIAAAAAALDRAGDARRQRGRLCVRPRGGDVCGPGGRVGPGRRCAGAPVPSLHHGADQRVSRSRARRDRDRADPGRAARPARAARRLPLRGALPVRDRALCRRPAARRGRARSPRRVLARREAETLRALAREAATWQPSST